MSSASYRPFVCAGIDVGKHHLDLALVRDGEPLGRGQRVTNTPRGHQAILDRLRHHAVALVVLEATGGYERAVAEHLAAHGVPVAIVNPRPVRDYARALGRLAKTDAIDAMVIARFGTERRPDPTVFPGPAQRQLQLLIARRRQLIAIRATERVHLEHADEPVVRDSMNAIIEAITEQIRQLDRRIAALIETHACLRQLDHTFRSVPGVGAVTSRTLLSDLPELGRVSRQRIAALVGVAPFNDDSGQHRGRRVIRGGRHPVRCTLYMAAVTAARVNPIIRPYYERLRAGGKSFKVAIVACMRKLLTHLNSLVRRHLQHLQPSPAP